MPRNESKIEIAAPPTKVREVVRRHQVIRQNNDYGND
jgi:hypothetical protein